MKHIIHLATLVILGIILFVVKFNDSKAQRPINDKPKISFTFDDGSIEDKASNNLEKWNQRLLDNLKKHHLKAIFYSIGKNKTNSKGNYILVSWNNAGHKISNHTFSHPNYNDKDITLDILKSEFLKNDSIIKKYSNYYPSFRFPYLKEGNTREKIDGFRNFLSEQGYRNGHVSVDASDWYIESRLLKRLKENPKADLSIFKHFYIQHIYDRAMFYDSLSFQLTNRRINHVLLLHHNLSAALFLDDLIQYFKDNEWDVLDADKAYLDTIYNNQPANIPAGESLIWALAKQSGKYENILRYPGEDGQYEKPKMDKLGL